MLKKSVVRCLLSVVFYYLCTMKYLIACLGNIGVEYDNTRHNIGFKVADYLNDDLKGTFTTSRLAQVSELRYKGRTMVVIKPTTYMNLSGKAVKYWMQQEKIPIENVLVVLDDLHAHGEIQQIIQKIEKRAEHIQQGPEDLANILIEISQEVIHAFLLILCRIRHWLDPPQYYYSFALSADMLAISSARSFSRISASIWARC